MNPRSQILKWAGKCIRIFLNAARVRHPDVLEDGLSPDEVLELLGPSWASMTTRQRLLYGVPGGLSESELKVLWGERPCDETADAA